MTAIHKGLRLCVWHALRHLLLVARLETSAVRLSDASSKGSLPVNFWGEWDMATNASRWVTLVVTAFSTKFNKAP